MAGARRGSVFLLTDYGHADEFAGVVRAVGARATHPGVPIVDLTHGVDAVRRPRRCPGAGARRAAPRARRRAGRRRSRRGTADGPWPCRWRPATRRARPHAFRGARQRAARRGPSTPSAAPTRPWCRFLPAADATGAATFDGRDLFAPAAARLWQAACRSTTSAHDVDPAHPGPAGVDPRLSVAPGRSRPRCCGSTASATCSWRRGPDDAAAAAPRRPSSR